MSEIIRCPDCRRQLRIEEEHRGRRVQCPSCHAEFRGEFSPSARTSSAPDTAAAAIREGEPALELTESASLDPERRRRIAIERPRPRRRPALIFGLIVGSIAVVLLVVGLIKTQVPDRPIRPASPENQEQRRQELLEAFRKQKPLGEEEITAEIKPLFKDLGEAYRSRNGQRVVQFFDAERMLEEMIAQGFIPRNFSGLRNRANVFSGMRDGMARTAEQSALLNWTDFEIRHLKKLEGNEAVVIVRHHGPDGTVLRLRWWVTKRSGTWKVFDLEDLDSGLRESNSLVGVPLTNVQQFQQVASGVQQLMQASQAIGLKRDADAAERHLQLIGATRFPNKIEALRQVVVALIQLQRNKNDEALASLDRAANLNSDMPLLDHLKGTAFNNLGKWQDALTHLDRYDALLGDDSSICFERGEALRGLNRLPEAAAAYRKALDYLPTVGDAYLGLIRSLTPGEPRPDLEARFAKLGNHHENFDVCADDCMKARDHETLEHLVRAMRKIDPNYAPANYYFALVHANAGRSAEAAKLFKLALAKQTNPALRQQYVTGFVQAMVDAGNAMHAYAAFPDAREGFRMVADDLLTSSRMDELKQVMQVHGKKYPAEPLLPFYQGELHVREGQYELAEKEFAAGLSRRPDENALARFRSSRAVARYYTGKVMSAYAEIGPKAETFTQLAYLCLNDKNKLAPLEELLAAHDRADPDSPDGLRFRVRLRIKQNKVADALALFKSGLAKLKADNASRQVVAEFLYDMAQAGKAVEAYEAAPDAREAFLILAADLQNFRKPQELRRLIVSHGARHADDPWLAYYAAEVHMQARSWDQAVKDYAAAWHKAGPDIRPRMAWRYTLAMYRAGRTLEAYRSIPPAKQTFRQLAGLLANERKPAELEALIAAHRPGAGTDPELFLYDMRAKLLRKKDTEAAALLQRACQLQTDINQRRYYIGTFVRALRAAGKGLDAYRAAPDKAAAFETLAQELVQGKEADKLDQLLQEHGKANRAAPAWVFYSGELKLLQGKFADAEDDFAAGFGKVPRQDQWKYRQALSRARIKQGKTIALYLESAKSTRAFEDLAYLCVADKNAGQLQALIVAHRKEHADDPVLPGWDLDLVWLKQDYPATLAHLEKNKNALMPRFRWKYDSYLVRSLVKLKRHAEAVREAERLTKEQPAGDRVLLVLAHAATGDVAKTIAAVKEAGSEPYLAQSCYQDLNLGPLLRSAAFERFQKEFPETQAEGGRDADLDD